MDIPIPVIGNIILDRDLGEAFNPSGVGAIEGGSWLGVAMQYYGFPVIPLDSWETARRVLAKYGGVLVYGVYDGAPQTFTPDGYPYLPPQAPIGWRYCWIPPGSRDQQIDLLRQIGIMSLPNFMDKYGFLLAAAIFGALAIYAAGPATVAEAAAGAPVAPAAATSSVAGTGEIIAQQSIIDATVEAAMLGGPAVGSGLELTAEQFLIASQSQAVIDSVAANSLAEVAPQLVSPTALTSLAKPLVTALLPAVLGTSAKPAGQVAQPNQVVQSTAVVPVLSGGIVAAGVLLLFVLANGKKAK